MIEQISRDLDLTFPYGEIERRAVGMVGAHQRLIVRQPPLHGVRLTRDARAEEVPTVRARVARPHERLIFLERLGTDHARYFVSGTSRHLVLPPDKKRPAPLRGRCSSS